jgi:carbonic anhydrase/acetyltransferase-like protein (isoleucine patch superfamily)
MGTVSIAAASRPIHMEPLTETRDFSALMVANRRLGDVLARRRKPLKNASEHLWIAENTWLSDAAVELLAQAQVKNCLFTNSHGAALAWTGSEIAPSNHNASEEVQLDNDSFAISYPWDLLRVNEIMISVMAADTIEGEVHPSTVVEGCLQVGKGTRILPGVFIEGNVVIGENCKIGPNCYIRGTTAIGDDCHIGQAVEVKNCIIMNGSSLGHLSYCGDSVIGEKVNFGAGTITANLRHDGKNHRSFVDGRLIDTGRRKLGVVVGDHVHTGIHTSLYPGRKIWPNCETRPGEIVQRDIQ